MLRDSTNNERTCMDHLPGKQKKDIAGRWLLVEVESYNSGSN